MYIYNALAFSTLLSSQETDAHHHEIFISYPGQPLNFTPEHLSCQLRFPVFYRDVAGTKILRPPAANPREPREQRVILGS